MIKTSTKLTNKGQFNSSSLKVIHGTGLNELTADFMQERIIDVMYEQGFAESTIGKRIKYLRKLFNWGCKTGITSYNPALELSVVRIEIRCLRSYRPQRNATQMKNGM